MKTRLHSSISHHDYELIITYSVITSLVVIKEADATVFRKYIWRPYGHYHLEWRGESFTLKAWTFPIFKFSLTTPTGTVCDDIFPKLKRYSIIMLVTGPVRQMMMVLAWLFS